MEFTMQQKLDSKGRNPKSPQMQESAHLSLTTQLETTNEDEESTPIRSVQNMRNWFLSNSVATGLA